MPRKPGQKHVRSKRWKDTKEYGMHEDGMPANRWTEGAAKKKLVYYPFRTNLFRTNFNTLRYDYRGLKYANMGIRRSMVGRKGFPTTKMGIYAGGRYPSGKKRSYYKTLARRQRAVKFEEKGTTKHRFVEEVIRETVGWAPYEKRALELIRAGNPKKALKFIRKRLGSHRAAKKKKSFLEAFQMAEAKKAQQAAKKRREAEAKSALAQQKREAEQKAKKKEAAQKKEAKAAAKATKQAEKE